MDKVELKIEQAVELLRAASMGRLIAGLIHNLNGPLHSLGMEMDVMGFILSKNPELESEIANKITGKLNRMEEEFDKLNTLIRQTADRAEAISSSPGVLLNINHFIIEELEFLNANLYFKHKVNTILDLDENAKGIKPRTESMALAFHWFLQAVVEDLEKNQLQVFLVKTKTTPHYFFAFFTTQDGSFSQDLMEPLTSHHHGTFRSEKLQYVETLLSVYLLRSSGVNLSLDTSGNHPQICVQFPYE